MSATSMGKGVLWKWFGVIPFNGSHAANKYELEFSRYIFSYGKTKFSLGKYRCRSCIVRSKTNSRYGITPSNINLWHQCSMCCCWKWIIQYSNKCWLWRRDVLNKNLWKTSLYVQTEVTVPKLRWVMLIFLGNQ